MISYWRNTCLILFGSRRPFKSLTRSFVGEDKKKNPSAILCLDPHSLPKKLHWDRKCYCLCPHPGDFRAFLRLSALDLQMVSQLRSLRRGHHGLDEQSECMLGALGSATKVWIRRVWCLPGCIAYPHETWQEGQPREGPLTSSRRELRFL